MATRRLAQLGLLVLLALVGTRAAQAQIIFGQSTYDDLGLTFTTWEIKGDSSTSTRISQFWIPLTGFVAAQEDLDIRYYVANASTNVDASSQDVTLSGFSDVRLQISRAFSNDQYLIGVGLNLPTGKKELALTDERQIVEILSESYLDFPLRRYGEGFGFNLLLGTAQRFGDWVGGAGLALEYAGSYKPYAEVDDYDPGDRFSINIRALRPGDKFTFYSQASFTASLPDQIDGVKVFKQSESVNLRVGGRFHRQAYEVQTDLRYLIRGRNSRYDSSETVVERLKLYGNELLASVSLTHRIAQNWSWTPSVTFKQIASDEEGFGSSHIVSIGAAAGARLGRQVNGRLGIRYHSGSADDGRIDLTGLQLFSGLSLHFR